MKIYNCYKKIHDIVKELHNKTALFLCKNYERIIIPVFGTREMVQDTYTKEQCTKIKNEKGIIEYKKEITKIRKTIRLNKRVKFVLSMLSHYKFRQHLIHKSIEYGCSVEVVTEEYTSITCTNCGIQSKNCVNRIKTCNNCKYQINRDVCGSRNILIKNLDIISKCYENTLT